MILYISENGTKNRLIPPLLVLALLCVFWLFALPQSPALAQEQEPALAAPTDLSASLSADGVILSWTAPEGQVDGYEILRQRPLQGETELSALVDNTGGSETSYTDTSATTPGEQYTYRVKAIRGDERSEASEPVSVDFVSVSCEIQAGDNHDILQCTASAGEIAITSALWTPSFEVQYAQTTSRPVATWVIADEYCGQSTDVQVEAHSGDSVLLTAQTTITLECSPEPADTLSVSCENAIENGQHVLRCALSGGDQTVTTARWTPQYDTESAQNSAEPNATETSWIIDAEYCGQITSVEVVPLSGTTTLPTVTTTFPLACVIMVDDNCSLANAIRSANGNAQVEESSDSDGNDDCEAGADPDDTADPPETGDDIILLKRNVTLQADLPSITSRVQLEGLAGAGRTISGDAKRRVLMVVDGQLSVNGVTITKGLASTVGGGIYVNSGSLSVSDSKIKDSKANDIGGGIYAIDSDVDIADTELSGNMTVKSHGGGMYFISSDGLNTLDIAGSTFKNNMATEDGGALKTAGGIVGISKSTFSENRSDEGGAIESSETTLNITNSTFSSNSAREGGGLSSFSSFVTLTHTTWAYNSAEEQGGGIAIIGWTGNFKIRNTLITNSASGGDCHSGPNPNIIIEFTGNFIQDGSCTPQPAESQAASGSAEFQAQAVEVAEAQITGGGGNPPIISGLTGNPPQHHPLPSGSPAIDAADPVYCTLDDQPDTARPQYGNCDIGAYEYPRVPPPPRQDAPPDDDDDPDPEPDPDPAPPETPTPEPPNICPVNDRIEVTSSLDDIRCEEVDVLDLDKHPEIQAGRFAARVWRYHPDCIHRVADGETLYGIANHYDTTVEVLSAHNGLSTDILSVGQALLLPACGQDALDLGDTQICFAVPGNLVFIDTSYSPPQVLSLGTTGAEGMTCAAISRPGTIVLTALDA